MKKNDIILILSILLALPISAQPLYWSDPVPVSPFLDGQIIHPRIVLTSENIPVISWALRLDGARGKAFVSRQKDDGSFFEPVYIQILDNLVRVGGQGPEIAARGDSVFVVLLVFEDNESQIFSVRSMDGGLTFTEPVRADLLDGDPIRLYPNIAIAPGGNPVISFMYHFSGFSQPEYQVVRSWDGGMTFGQAVRACITAPGEACPCCPGEILVRDSLQIMLWRNNVDNIRDIYAAASTNGGISFDASAEIDTSNWYLPACPASAPGGLISNNTLYSVWMTGATGQSRIRFGTMNTETMQIGGNWEVDPVVSNNISQNHPRIAGNRDTLGVVWEDHRNGHTSVYFAFSTNGGDSFESSGQIQNLTQHPDIAFADGLFHIVYRDMETNRIKYKTANITLSTNVNNPEIPNQSVLYQNYPNPFNAETTFKFDLHRKSAVSLKIFDLNGRLIKTLLNEVREPGEYFIQWDGRNENNSPLSSQILFYQLKTDNDLQTKMASLLKK